MRGIKTRVAVLFGLGVAVVLALGIGAAYGTSPAAQGKLRNGGTLTIGLAEDPDALDPTLARTFVGRIVFLHMCEKLYDLNGRLQVVPQLAAGLPKVSRDKLTVTIRLRRGLRFNDGTPFNAQAVKVSLDRHRTLARSSRASELSPVSAVGTRGANTVVIHLKEPYAPLTAQLADRSGMVLSPGQVDKLGDRFATNPVCVGPFRFVSRTAGDRIVLSKSPFYYGRKRVHLSRIVFRIITEPSARAAALRAHDIDVLDRIASTNIAEIARDRSLRIIKSVSIGYQGLTLNIGNKNGLGKLPYQNVGTALAAHPGLRQALELAIDRKQLNRVVFGGTNLPDCGPIAPASPWFDRTTACNTGRNLARARQLVRQSGVSRPNVRLMIGTDAVAARLGQFIQAQAREAGFNVVLQPTEFVTALRKADAGDFDVFAIGWSGRIDPDGNIYQFVHTKGSLNDAGFSNARLDRMLDQARQVSAPGARKELYRNAVRLIRSTRPLIYLWHPINRFGVNQKVGGVQVFGDGLIRAQFAGFKAGS
jgi:peptide/nickel transport system substrate-binding protein